MCKIFKYLFVFICLLPLVCINAQSTGEGYGMINTKGAVVMPFVYDKVEPNWAGGYSIITVQGNEGIFSHKGAEILPPMYQKLKHYPTIGLTAAQYNGKWGIVDNHNFPIVKFVHSGLRDINLQEKIIPLMINNKIVLLDYDGRKRDSLPTGIYQNYYMLGNGLLAVTKKGSHQFGIITLRGRNIVPPGTYDMVSSLQNQKGIRVSRCADRITCTHALINRKGELLTLMDFEDINESYPEGQNIIAMRKGKKGTINGIGRTVIPFIYSTIEYLADGCYAVIKPDDTYGVVNELGNEIIPCKYERGTTYYPKAKLGKAKLDFAYALVDETGKAITGFDFDEMGSPSEDMVVVVKGIKSGFINKSGEQVIPCIYSDVKNFSEGYAVVIDGDKYGVINKKGEMVIPFGIYEKIASFNNGAAVIFKNGKYGIIDKNGNVVVEPTYTFMGNSVNGLIVAKK